MAPIGVAIIGGGLWVKIFHIPAVLKAPELELKAIYSRSLNTAQAAAASVPEGVPTPDLYSSDSGAGKSYADLLARDDIAAVIVCVPILEGAPHAEQALREGKHVLTEKPIAKDVARAKELIAEHEKLKSTGGKATLCVGENWRFIPPVVYARDEAKELGRLTHFHGSSSMPIATDSMWLGTEWRKTPSHQGGFVLDAGIHQIAVVRSLIGPDALSTVMAYTSQIKPYLKPFDTINSIFRTRSGATGSHVISMGLPVQGFEYTFSYEKGSIVLADEMKKVTITKGDEVIEREFDISSYGMFEEVQAWGEGLVRGEMDPLQGTAEALADLEVMEGMFKSGAEGGKEQKFECQ